MNERIIRAFANQPVVWAPMWGISKLRKRDGRFNGAILGESLWYDEWYDIVMSKKSAAKLADLGVNLVVLPFSMGGSPEIEKEERDDFERMTGYLHEYGIKSMPYLQYQNILNEAMELPDSRWGVYMDGKRHQFGDRVWRRGVCQASPGFIRHMKEQITDACRRGADGIWIDNTYLDACKCESCRKAFHKYLAAHRADLLEDLFLMDFEHVEMPYDQPVKLVEKEYYCFEPIVQAYIDFVCHQNLEIQRELKSHIEKMSPHLFYGSNPAPYRGFSHFAKGVDFYHFYKVHEMMYLENQFYPGKKDGAITGNFHGFVACADLGVMGIPGAWRKIDFDFARGQPSSGFPENMTEMRRILFEAMVFGGALGMFWAVRTIPLNRCDSEDDLLRMYFEIPEFREPVAKTIAFLKTVPAHGKKKNIANVAVMYHCQSLKLNFNQGAWSSIHSAEEMLLSMRIPYRVLCSEEIDRMGDFDLVLLPDVKNLDDEEAARIRAFVTDGGKLLAIGLPGTRDFRNRYRKESLLKDVFNASIFSKSRATVFNDCRKGKTALIPWSGLSERTVQGATQTGKFLYPAWVENIAEVKKALLQLLAGSKQVEITGAGALGVSLCENSEGATIVQILSYEDEPAEQNLKIEIRNSISRGRTARCMLPDADSAEQSVPITKPGRDEYTLQGFKQYGAVIIT